MQNHLKLCEFATVPCPQCQDPVWKNSVEEHMNQDCLQRLITCPDCVESIIFAEKQVRGDLKIHPFIFFKLNLKAKIWTEVYDKDYS